MTYKEFLAIAYPEHKREFDRQLTIMSRFYRPIGNYMGYVLWSIGLTANFVSSLRVVMMLGAMFLLTLSGPQYLWLRLLAPAILFLGKIMDCTDGVMARASRKGSKLGERMDSFSDRPVRAGMSLALIGYSTGIIYMIPWAIFVQWVIHMFGQPLRDLNYNKDAKRASFIAPVESMFLDMRPHEMEGASTRPWVILVNLVVKVFKCDFAHFVILPLYIAICQDQSWYSKTSLAVIAAYTVVMIIRLVGGVLDYGSNNPSKSTDGE